MNEPETRASGLTLRACGWILFGLVLIAGIVQFSGVFRGDGYQLGGEVIPMPVLMVVGIWALLAAAAKRLVGWRWLTPPEMLVVLYALMLATPIMSTGFWRLYLTTVATVVRFNTYDKYDAMSPKMWPHGQNLLATAFAAGEAGVKTEGNVRAARIETGARTAGPGFVLENTGQTVSSITARVPVYQEGALQMPLDEPYFFTALVRLQDLGPRSSYFVRLRFDGQEGAVQELVRSRQPGKPGAMQPEGFARIAAYGITVPADFVQESVTLEAGLDGSGTMEIVDAQWLNVAALEFAYKGRPAVSEAEFAALPEAVRGSVAVIPDRMWSMAGLKTLVQGYVPWGAWGNSFLFLGGYLFLMTLASLAVACLLRRQWMQSERFPVPLIYGPLALVDGAAPWHGGKPYTKQPLFWIGFGLFLIWCLLMGLHFYNPSIPSTRIGVPLRAYFADPTWIKVWSVTFTVLPLALAVALFFEINVLGSLLLGFVLFRLQFMVGEWTGWSVDQSFPYKQSQLNGSILVYALVVIWLARRFLAKTVQAAWKGESDRREILSPRGSFAMLIASLVGILFWAVWAGLPTFPVFLVTLIFLMILFVAMRLRTEIGITSPGFLSTIGPGGGGSMLVIFTALFGSVAVFGVEGLAFATFITILLFGQHISFALIPGMQMEFVEAGSRLKVRGRSIIYGAVLGVLGGMLVGGWIYLSGAYAVGADNFPIPGQFNTKAAAFGNMNSQLAVFDEAAKTGESAWVRDWMSPQGAAFLFGAVGTLGLSLIRQVFAGFWFHPAGFLLSPTQMMEETWGAVALALLIRFLVLRLGGAAAVREKLFPFGAGAILGVGAAMFLFLCEHVYRYFFSPTDMKFPMQF